MINKEESTWIMKVSSTEDFVNSEKNIVENKSISISGKCTSGMPRPPRVLGITTPKEFYNIINAISFLKRISYPIFGELVWAVSGIKKTNNSENNKRVKALIYSIVELNQIYNDIYSDRYRRIETTEEGIEYVLYPDGDRSDEAPVIEMVRKIQQKKITDNRVINRVDAEVYSGHAYYHFIPDLLSKKFILNITKKKYNPNDPIHFYKIEPYHIVLDDFRRDIIYETYKKRWMYYLLENGFDNGAVFKLSSFSERIGRIFGYVALKYRPYYKKNLQSTYAIEKHGEHLFKLYISSAENGGHIHSRITSLRFFNEQSPVNFHTDFFNKRKVFRKGWLYLRYEPTKEMDLVAEEVFDFIRRLDFEEPANPEIQETEDIFSFDMDELMELDIRDRMNIFVHALGVKDNRVWVNIKRKDNGFNRVYSLITQLNSKSRLGLIEHDVGTCQQTVMMNVVDRWDDYPLHKELIENKKAFRENFMDILDCDYEEAKIHITAISNGRSLDFYKNKNIQEKLKSFAEEARRLSEEFVEIVHYSDNTIYSMAEALAKDAKKDDLAIDGKKFYGILFHIYGYYERQLREAMKSCFSKPVYDVHDAVYCRERIEPAILEHAVKDNLGFTVHIES